MTCRRAKLELRFICDLWQLEGSLHQAAVDAPGGRTSENLCVCVAVAAVAAAAGAFVTVRLAEYGIGLLSSVEWKYERASVFS